MRDKILLSKGQLIGFGNVTLRKHCIRDITQIYKKDDIEIKYKSIHRRV